jgi:metal-responsive CopG/Arc/MetJ family transcriptional regulator
VANARGKVTIVSEVSDELRDATDERAAAEGRSRSELIGRALRFYLAHAPVIEADAVPAPVAGSPRKGAVR